MPISSCLILFSLPAVLLAQKDSLAHALGIKYFSIHKSGRPVDRYMGDTAILLSARTDSFFEKLNITSIDAVLKNVCTKKYFTKQIDDGPELILTDSLHPYWRFTATSDVFYASKLRVRKFTILANAKTGTIIKRTARSFWFKSPPTYP